MICSAQMHTDAHGSKCMNAKSHQGEVLPHSHTHGFTMAELLVVVAIVSLFVAMAQIHLFGLLRKNKFKAQIQELVSTMQMAASSAAETGRRYEIIIDITDQSYGLKHITGSEIYVDTPDETPGEMIVHNYLTGWQNGGKIVLLDEKEQPYSIVVNRINRIVVLEEGDLELLEPKPKDDLPF